MQTEVFARARLTVPFGHRHLRYVRLGAGGQADVLRPVSLLEL